jgi:acyl-phosphate glycerol 3-phosphate acyltransferase
MTALSMTAFTILVAYLIGAIPFGFLVARWRGVDIFKQGSGNIGATNVGRVLGRRFGILVFMLDFAKGALPALAASWVTLPAEDSLQTALGKDGLGVIAGLAAFLGHLFPIYLRFRGGKGVATGAGVVAVLLPGPALGALLTWVALLAAFRYVSLASLGAATVLCLLRLGLTPEPFAPCHRILTCFCFVAMALVFLRHRANVTRLLHGNENRLKDTPTMFHLNKILHVLAVGLWFGTTIFFTFVVGLSLFGTFEALSAKPAGERPFWFPLPAEFDKARPSEQFPEPLRKEQGSRVAGTAVGPMFDWYYGIGTVCGVLALATALSWSRLPGKVQRTRLLLIGSALVTVGLGWYLEYEVEARRVVRSETSDAVLRAARPGQESIQAANDARKDFGRWHFYSLMANFLTVLLVTVVMALTALLPATASIRQSANGRSENETENKAYEQSDQEAISG